MKPPFRSEAICAYLMEQGIDIEKITVKLKGGFRKSYSNDVEELAARETDDTTVVNVVINRDGIYDKLPEGLFHQTKGNSRVRTVQDAVDEHKRFKEEERQARKFFAPVEQLLFQYKIFAEKEEQDALFNLQNGQLSQAFYDFWNITEDLPMQEAGRMLQLMPYTYFIKGNREATETALAYILNKKVVLRQEERLADFVTQEPVALSETRTGINSVLGNTANEFFQYWIFSIEASSNEEMRPFVVQRAKTNILQKFEDLFIPLEVDTAYEFEVQEKEIGTQIDSVLGYGAHI